MGYVNPTLWDALHVAASWHARSTQWRCWRCLIACLFGALLDSSLRWDTLAGNHRNLPDKQGHPRSAATTHAQGGDASSSPLFCVRVPGSGQGRKRQGPSLQEYHRCTRCLSSISSALPRYPVNCRDEKQPRVRPGSRGTSDYRHDVPWPPRLRSNYSTRAVWNILKLTLTSDRTETVVTNATLCLSLIHI